MVTRRYGSEKQHTCWIYEICFNGPRDESFVVSRRVGGNPGSGNVRVSLTTVGWGMRVCVCVYVGWCARALVQRSETG